ATVALAYTEHGVGAGSHHRPPRRRGAGSGADLDRDFEQTPIARVGPLGGGEPSRDRLDHHSHLDPARPQRRRGGTIGRLHPAPHRRLSAPRTWRVGIERSGRDLAFAGANLVRRPWDCRHGPDTRWHRSPASIAGIARSLPRRVYCRAAGVALLRRTLLAACA